MGPAPIARRLTVVAVAVAVVGAGCAAAVAVGGELSTGAHVAVLLTGSLVAAVALGRRAGAGAAPAGWPGLPWLGAAGVLVVFEVVSLAAPGLPTVSDLLDPALASPLPRGAATLAWYAAGIWLAARPGPPPAPIARRRARGGPAGAVASAMRTTAGRAVVLAAWLWVGVHFLAR